MFLLSPCEVLLNYKESHCNRGRFLGKKHHGVMTRASIARSPRTRGVCFSMDSRKRAAQPLGVPIKRKKTFSVLAPLSCGALSLSFRRRHLELRTTASKLRP